MSETLTRAEPLPTTLLNGPGVALYMAAPMMRYSLRARNVAAVAAMLEMAVPAKIGRCEGDVACLGPDEWLWRSATCRQFSASTGTPVAVVDVSERSTCLIVEGPRAASVLQSGCPLDLDRFDAGRATRTIYETVEIILFRKAQDRFEIEVWRSFAPWLWQALSTAASY
jgi:sarcosine oxidase subunit gamma